MFESRESTHDDHGRRAGGSGLSTWLESIPVGGSALGQLAQIDPDAIDAGQRVDLLVAWTRQLSHVQAMQAHVVASMAHHDNDPVQVAGGSITDPVAEEIGCVLHVSAFSAHLLVDLSRTLATRLPNILALVQAGTITLAVARAVVQELPATWSGPTDPAHDIEQVMLARLVGRTPSEVRRSAKRVIHRMCPADADRRAKTARRGRGVSLFAQPDAMMTVCLLLPAAYAQFVYHVIDQAARRRVAELKAASARGESVDVPGVDATRADIFVELAVALERDGSTGTTGRAQCTVAVVVDLVTAMGLAQNPGEIPGYGPVPASVAQSLAADGQWVRWLTDPDTGALLDAGRRTYRPSAALRSFITARDLYCRFPGCQGLATGITAEIDHAEPFNHTDPDAGGATTRANLGALCRKHHRYRTGGLWTIGVSDFDGTCEWISRTGHRYPGSANDILTNDDDQVEPLEPEPPPEPGPRPERTGLEERLAHFLCA